MIDGADLPGQTSDPDTLAAAAAAQILRRIETLQLAPGAIVTERTLSAELGIGKAPVREALLRLSGSGLVTPRSGSGYVIAPITLRQARSLFELWLALDRAAIASLKGRDVVPEFLDYPVAQLEESIDGVDSAAQGRALQAFAHVLTLACSGNAAIMRAFPQSEITRLLCFAESLGSDASCAHSEHITLWEAIRAGEIDRALQLADTHVRDLQTRVLGALVTAAQVQEINLAPARD